MPLGEQGMKVKSKNEIKSPSGDLGAKKLELNKISDHSFSIGREYRFRMKL